MDHLARKYGTTREQAQSMHDQMTAVAATEGLDFRFDIARSGNTFDAHRLTHLAAAHGLQDAMKERLLRAYLSEGEPIGDPSALERLAIEVGLPADEVRDLLAGDRYAAEVRDDEGTAAALGITAVPFFVVDRAIAASGAQPPALLARAPRPRLEAARTARHVRERRGLRPRRLLSSPLTAQPSGRVSRFPFRFAMEIAQPLAIRASIERCVPPPPSPLQLSRR